MKLLFLTPTPSRTKAKGRMPFIFYDLSDGLAPRFSFSFSTMHIKDHTYRTLVVVVRYLVTFSFGSNSCRNHFFTLHNNLTKQNYNYLLYVWVLQSVLSFQRRVVIFWMFYRHMCRELTSCYLVVLDIFSFRIFSLVLSSLLVKLLCGKKNYCLLNLESFLETMN